MKDSTKAALDRISRSLSNSGAKKRPIGCSTLPFVLAGGLIMGYQMLVRLIPAIWANILPGGFEQGQHLVGLPHGVWALAWFAHLHFSLTVAFSCVVVGLGFLLGRWPFARPVVWLMAISVILFNAAILIIALKTGMDANGVGHLFG